MSVFYGEVAECGAGRRRARAALHRTAALTEINVVVHQSNGPLVLELVLDAGFDHPAVILGVFRPDERVGGGPGRSGCSVRRIVQRRCGRPARERTARADVRQPVLIPREDIADSRTEQEDAVRLDLAARGVGPGGRRRRSSIGARNKPVLARGVVPIDPETPDDLLVLEVVAELHTAGEYPAVGAVPVVQRVVDCRIVRLRVPGIAGGIPNSAEVDAGIPPLPPGTR